MILKNFLTNYKYSIVTFIACYIISFLLRSIGLDLGGAFTLVSAFLNSAIILLVINIIAKIRLKPVWISILTFLLVFDTVYYIFFQSCVSIGIIESIVATDSSEAYEVSKGLLPLGFILFAAFYWLVHKSVDEFRKVNFKIRYSLLLSLAIIFLFPFALTLRFNKETKATLLEHLKMNPILLMSEAIGMKYPLVVGNIFNIAGYFENVYMLSQAAQIKRPLPTDFQLNDSIVSPEKIFLVVGESSLRTHYSLYGYSVKTTPFLDSLSVDKEQMQFYENVISPASYTLEAMKQTLSLATPLDNSPFFEEMNILELANNSGYKTYWISNQNKVGLMNNVAGVIAASAEVEYFESDNIKDDLNLVRIVKQKIIPQQKQLFVIHLRGSHIEYDTRFDEYDTQQLGSEGEYIKFDKSIHHTDRTLRDLHKVMLDTKSRGLIYYYSDHGEIVNLGHAILNGGCAQYEIPLVTLTNEAQVDSIVRSYYDIESKRLNSSSTSYILSEIMGYKIKPERKEAVIKAGRYVRQSDNKTYLYSDLEKSSK